MLVSDRIRPGSQLSSLLRDAVPPRERPIDDIFVARQGMLELIQRNWSGFASLSSGRPLDPETRQRILQGTRDVLGLKPNAEITVQLVDHTGQPIPPGSRFHPFSGIQVLAGGRVLAEGSLDFSTSGRPSLNFLVTSPLFQDRPDSWVVGLQNPSPDRPQETLRKRMRAELALAELVLPPSFDRRARLDLLQDPGLQHLSMVIRQLSALERNGTMNARTALQDLTTSAPGATTEGRVASWVSRMLVMDRLLPTAENIEACLIRIRDTRNQLAHIPLFRGRSTVVGTTGELVSETRGRPLHDLPTASLRHGDYHRAGTPRLLTLLQTETGDRPALFRPEAAVHHRLTNVLRLHSAALPGLLREPAERSPTQNEHIAALTRDIRSALGLTGAIGLTCTARPGFPAEYQFTVNAIGQTPSYIANLRLTDGVVSSLQEVQNTCRGAASLERTPQTVKDQLLRAIRETPPGRNGFLFVFQGHGNADGISLSPDCFISPSEMRAAIHARQTRFGEQTRNDVYIFDSCRSHDFVVEVSNQLSGREGNPFFLATSDSNQPSWGLVDGQLVRGGVEDILEQSAKLRTLGQRSFNLGDLFDFFQTDHQRFMDCPTIFGPSPIPNRRGTGVYQISGDTNRHRSEHG